MKIIKRRGRFREKVWMHKKREGIKTAMKEERNKEQRNEERHEGRDDGRNE
jgi:hypothetical protein